MPGGLQQTQRPTERAMTVVTVTSTTKLHNINDPGNCVLVHDLTFPLPLVLVLDHNLLHYLVPLIVDQNPV